MTYSIIARDSSAGELGTAVASRFFAVGALIPHICGMRAGVATQAIVNPLWGLEAAGRLSNGEAAQAVIADLVSRDPQASVRQIHAIDSCGRIAAHTGGDCVEHAGYVFADGVSVAGNMLAGPEVLAATLAAYRETAGQPLAGRLLVAMAAGEAAGGDRRRRQSASLRVHRGEDFPFLDLRADDHPDPLAELRRLYAVAQLRFIPFAETLPQARRKTSPAP